MTAPLARLAATAALALAATALTATASHAENSTTATLGGGATWTTSKGTPTTAGGVDAGLWANTSYIAKTVTTTGYENDVTVLGRGSSCSGDAVVDVYVDGSKLGSATLTSATAYQTVHVGAGVGLGTHTVKVQLANDYATNTCDRNAYISGIGTSVIRPSAATTGAGTGLTTVGPGSVVKATNGASFTIGSNGKLKIDKSDLTISGYDIKGIVSVTGSNVTITNSRIRGMSLGAITTEAASTPNTRLYSSAGSGNVISHSTIAPDAYYQNADGTTTVDPRWIGLGGGGFTADHDDISKAVDLIQTTADNVTVSASYLHDNTQYAAGKDPWLQVYNGGRYKADPSHSDGWQVEGGSNVTLEGTNIVKGPWSAMQFTQNALKTNTVVISNNWLSGGECTVNIHDNSGRGPILPVTITNNVFEGTINGSGCNIIAQTTTRAKAVVTGNTRDGQPANTITNGGADTK